MNNIYDKILLSFFFWLPSCEKWSQKKYWLLVGSRVLSTYIISLVLSGGGCLFHPSSSSGKKKMMEREADDDSRWQQQFIQMRIKKRNLFKTTQEISNSKRRKTFINKYIK
jgi:hypothetical protein